MTDPFTTARNDIAGLPGHGMSADVQVAEQRVGEVTQADRDTADALDEALGFLMDAEREIVLEALVRHRLAAAPKPAVPIPMILHCPTCHTQHIDEPDERTPEWDNPPHRSHLCHACGCNWRPADVPTEGIAQIATCGKADTPKPADPTSVAGERITDDDLEDEIAEAINDSLDMDWSGDVGARAVMALLREKGLTMPDNAAELRDALTRYMAAVEALGARSTIEPSRNLFDERPMSVEGTTAWLELNEAGKQAAAALATNAPDAAKRERGE